MIKREKRIAIIIKNRVRGLELRIHEGLDLEKRLASELRTKREIEDRGAEG